MIWQTSVGKKLLMALTGILMLLFLVGHTLGNLSFYWGADALNAYAEHLRALGPLLWIERLIMAGVLVLHVALGITLFWENSQAKPVRYAKSRYQEAGPASRTMFYTGLVILAFVVYHLLHFTVRVTNPAIYEAASGEGHFGVYRMAEMSFQSPWISLIYLAAMAAVLIHLSHGVGSFFQSVGWNTDWTKAWVNTGSYVLAGILFATLVSIPAAFCLFGM
ncbi:MAG: succinate dehydrogenase cytochrome b subunit [Desulfohalobiaceae bacterium]|nr:succinate dehydrogenase cytochrome b subunit [Desulfohalobiaceae bacterium]